MNKYFIVDKKILPDYFEKVVEIRNMLEKDHDLDVTNACKKAGISRSTYYKYKDEVFELKSNTIGRKAELNMLLKHENGALNKVIELISASRCNILSIYQAIPINNVATLSLQIDISNLNKDIDELIEALKKISFVRHVKLVSIE